MAAGGGGTCQGSAAAAPPSRSPHSNRAPGPLAPPPRARVGRPWRRPPAYTGTSPLRRGGERSGQCGAAQTASPCPLCPQGRRPPCLSQALQCVVGTALPSDSPGYSPSIPSVTSLAGTPPIALGLQPLGKQGCVWACLTTRGQAVSDSLSPGVSKVPPPPHVAPAQDPLGAQHPLQPAPVCRAWSRTCTWGRVLDWVDPQPAAMGLACGMGAEAGATSLEKSMDLDPALGLVLLHSSSPFNTTALSTASLPCLLLGVGLTWRPITTCCQIQPPSCKPGSRRHPALCWRALNIQLCFLKSVFFWPSAGLPLPQKRKSALFIFHPF